MAAADDYVPAVEPGDSIMAAPAEVAEMAGWAEAAFAGKAAEVTAGVRIELRRQDHPHDDRRGTSHEPAPAGTPETGQPPGALQATRPGGQVSAGAKECRAGATHPCARLCSGREST